MKHLKSASFSHLWSFIQSNYKLKIARLWLSSVMSLQLCNQEEITGFFVVLFCCLNMINFIHFICIFLSAENVNVTLFWIKSLCLRPFLSIYRLARCTNKKWWTLITFMKMNLKLLLFYTTSHGNTTLEWIAKTNQMHHSTYSMKSKSKEFLFIRTMLAFHGTENRLSFPDLFVFFVLYGAITVLPCNSITSYFPLAIVWPLLS